MSSVYHEPIIFTDILVVTLQTSNYSIAVSVQIIYIATVWYKILEGENLGEFGKLQEIRQNFPS